MKITDEELIMVSTTFDKVLGNDYDHLVAMEELQEKIRLIQEAQRIKKLRKYELWRVLND